MLKPKGLNKALLPPAGTIRGLECAKLKPHPITATLIGGVGCAPRVTKEGNGVAEIGYPFGIAMKDQNRQTRAGTLLGGHNETHPNWHSNQPVRMRKIPGYGANDAVKWMKRYRS